MQALYIFLCLFRTWQAGHVLPWGTRPSASTSYSTDACHCEFVFGSVCLMAGTDGWIDSPGKPQAKAPTPRIQPGTTAHPLVVVVHDVEGHERLGAIEDAVPHRHGGGDPLRLDLGLGHDGGATEGLGRRAGQGAVHVCVGVGVDIRLSWVGVGAQGIKGEVAVCSKQCAHTYPASSADASSVRRRIMLSLGGCPFPCFRANRRLPPASSRALEAPVCARACVCVYVCVCVSDSRSID